MPMISLRANPNRTFLPEGTRVYSHTSKCNGIIVFVDANSIHPYGIYFDMDFSYTAYWHSNKMITCLGLPNIEELLTHECNLIRAIGRQQFNNKE